MHNSDTRKWPNFEDSFSGKIETTNEHKILQEARKVAYDAFLQRGLPSRKDEDFQYMTLSRLLSQGYKRPSFLKTTGVYESRVHASAKLVFINGRFIEECSFLEGLEKCIVLPLDKAVRTYSAIIKNNMRKIIQEEKDPFVLLNMHTHENGLFFYVPPKTKISVPVEIVHIIDAENTSWVMPRISVFLSEGAELTLVTTKKMIRGEDIFYNSAVDAHLAKGSKLSYIDDTIEKTALEGFHFASFFCTLDEGSILDATEFGSSSYTRKQWRIVLLEKQSEATLRGMWLLHNKKEAHTNIIMEHRAPHCRSMQLMKGIVDNEAKSSFQGRIIVRKEADKTEAYQLNKNVTLSPFAKVNTKPGLEIFASDVKASHGATTGQLSKEELFYMRARGIREKDAKNYLIRAFLDDVVREIPLEALRDKAIECIQSFSSHAS